jgi:hypothetical protein
MVTTRENELLREFEERILVRYFDNEAAWWERLWAKRLISTRPSARAFMDTMRTIGEIARNGRAGILARNPEPVDLWGRIKNRIEAEEKAAIFLGQRSAPRVGESLGAKIAGFFSVDHLIWGGSGALVAASVLFFVLQRPLPPPTVAMHRAGHVQLAENNGNIRRVSQARPSVRRSLPDEQLYSEPLKILEPDVPNTVEVDWMRSSGRVRMMHEPGEGSTLIWVKRRAPIDLAMREPAAGGPPVVVYGQRFDGQIPINQR